jgi:hypothetical protein
MRAFHRPPAHVFLIFLARVEVRARSAPNSDSPPAGQSSNSIPAARQHAKNVWTNENIGTVAGHGSTVRSGYVGRGATTRLSIPVNSWIPRNADQSDEDKHSNSTR